MKTVLITGTSSGIGKETVLLFQKKGWNVAAGMRNPEKEEVLTKLANVKCYHLDVKDKASCEKFIQNALNDFGSFEVLVNNAGIYLNMPFEISSEQEAADIIDTNLFGTANVMKAALPFLRKQRKGVIINVSSVAGRTTFPHQSFYHASKWALEGMSECMFYELKNTGVKIKLIEPGMVKTSLYKNMKNPDGMNIPEEYRTSFKAWYKFLTAAYEKGYQPAKDAKTIFKAATDGSKRLRYTTDFTTRYTLFLRRMLPERLFMKLIAKVCGV
ncbi:MAG TPA: SDR family oxidoreductase [Spirochaetota bacterium]|nr:SDR family oxidoreductase [Spirochaetota bacterium]HOR44985.1 SDR family oxidoreductase [Spirochaetota bacterium]HPK56688.1 SDR family oxidoreductase [Spirochaetota bacterium]